MNCRNIQEQIAAAPIGAPPATAGEHLAFCADCQAFARRDATVRRLLALKRMEQPDPHFETRLIARVHGEIANTTPARGWFGLPVLRFVLGTAVAILVAVPVIRVAMTVDQNQSGFSTAASVKPMEIAPIVPPSAEPPMLQLRELATLPPAPATTNFGPAGFAPAGIQYGPGPSVPVKFEY